MISLFHDILKFPNVLAHHDSLSPHHHYYQIISIKPHSDQWSIIISSSLVHHKLAWPALIICHLWFSKLSMLSTYHHQWFIIIIRILERDCPCGLMRLEQDCTWSMTAFGAQAWINSTHEGNMIMNQWSLMRMRPNNPFELMIMISGKES